MIYLDNSATTKPSEKAMEAVTNAMRSIFGNPSSTHCAGIEASHALSAARKSVAGALNVPEGSVYFTPGGTQADNTAIFGGAKHGVGAHIVTTSAEHPAVLEAVRALEKRDFKVTCIQPDSDGNISLESIETALQPDTSLVSIMTVNNETGAIFPVWGVKALINRHCPRALFHTDAVQALGKLELFPEKWGVDMLSVSAHKIHGVKGTGALYIRKGVSLLPFSFGGGQEKGISNGTENLPGIMGFAAACEEIDYKNFEKVKALSSLLKEKISPFSVINSPDNGLPYILNASFGKIPSEVILNALSAEGICASAGSACASNKSGDSHVLRAMGKNPLSAVRFSFSAYNTEEEITKTAAVLEKVIPMLERVV